MVIAAARVVTRWWIEKRLRVDDYLLLFSCVSLVVSTVNLYYVISEFMSFEKLALNPPMINNDWVIEGFGRHVMVVYTANVSSFFIFSELALLFTKYGFLALFKPLVDRLPRMYNFWKAAVISTTLIFAYMICANLVACPTSTGKPLNVLHMRDFSHDFIAQCYWMPQLQDKALALGVLSSLLDILTDVLSSSTVLHQPRPS